MKKSVLFLLMACFSISLTAQKPLATFFSEDGHKFWVIMDGKKMNDEPAFRVEDLEMDNDWAKVRIIFEDPKLKPLDKTIQGIDVDGNISSVTWVIKQIGKGKFRVNASSWKPIEKANERPTKTDNLPGRSEKQIPSPATEQTTRVPTAHKTDQSATSDVSVTTGTDVFSMKVDIDDGQTTSRMDINIGLPDFQPSEIETSGTFVTTTTNQEHDFAEAHASVEKHDPLPGYGGRIGCENPMPAERFASAQNSISSKSFEDSKLTVAKQVINANCLLVSQVKEIMSFFDFESTKLEFAKAAYDRTYDIDNYYEINDVFDFESSIREMNNYIQNK